jgi:hypothetical protein
MPSHCAGGVGGLLIFGAVVSSSSVVKEVLALCRTGTVCGWVRDGAKPFNPPRSQQQEPHVEFTRPIAESLFRTEGLFR